jgi:hypothetical protein
MNAEDDAMATYERHTVASSAQVLALAEEVLTSRLPVAVQARDAHAIRLSGGDGTVTIEAHRHGMATVVHAETDQLRTSRLDLDVQYFMTMLPYQPGDMPGKGRGVLPGGLSRRQ